MHKQSILARREILIRWIVSHFEITYIHTYLTNISNFQHVFI